MIKYWHMQMHPNNSGSITGEQLLRIIKDERIIGIGSDNCDAGTFKNMVDIGDVVLVRHLGNPLCLVEVVSDSFSIKKDGIWCDCVRNVLILDSDLTGIIKKQYTEEKPGCVWTQNLFLPVTFQNAESSDFVDWWYNKSLKKLAEKHEIIADIKSVRDILKMDLRIPPFQRPYKWEKKQVYQLLNDVKKDMQCKTEPNSYSDKSSISKYRIGSLILCIDTESSDKIKNCPIDIVDGQQRITTILLILTYLKANFDCKLVEKLKYNSSISYDNIKSNFKAIESWFEKNTEIVESFANHLLDNCEMVYIKVFEISEAFQMFDSQNGTGLPLAPYNLLKAYHLNSIKDSVLQEMCDVQWEKAGHYYYSKYNRNLDLLKQLFSEQLYKTRIWNQNYIPETFTREKIDEFKGNDFENRNNNLYSYQNSDLLKYLADELPEESIKEFKIKTKLDCITDPKDIRNFMQITDSISNGNYFFKYVDTYFELYKELFLSESEDNVNDFRGFYQTYCFYSKYYRDGDTYLRELYKTLIIRLYDRFGKDNFSAYNYKLLFAYVYQNRLLSASIKKARVLKLPVQERINPFIVIEHAKNPEDLSVLEQFIILKNKDLLDIESEHQKAVDTKVREKASYVPELIKFFRNDEIIKNIIGDNK